MRYWLMKTEPDVFSIDDLKSQKTTPWEGVRNYQARNFMRDEMKKGDMVLIYHSNTKPPGVAGIGVVSKEAFPDHFAWDKKSKYFDPKSTKENPRWMMVEVKFKKKFKELISLSEIKETKGLEGMLILRKGNRLSITPVDKKHFDKIVEMA
ncbi:MAG: EVE domain-containing protein [Halobacteriovoraceae bacterium]|nr:EVE domain-containing protein [Halobacteriovoraceae bacterium]